MNPHCTVLIQHCRFQNLKRKGWYFERQDEILVGYQQWYDNTWHVMTANKMLYLLQKSLNKNQGRSIFIAKAFPSLFYHSWGSCSIRGSLQLLPQRPSCSSTSHRSRKRSAACHQESCTIWTILWYLWLNKREIWHFLMIWERRNDITVYRNMDLLRCSIWYDSAYGQNSEESVWKQSSSTYHWRFQGKRSPHLQYRLA